LTSATIADRDGLCSLSDFRLGNAASLSSFQQRIHDVYLRVFQDAAEIQFEIRERLQWWQKVTLMYALNNCLQTHTARACA